MYLAVDVGGTKILLAAFEPNGKLKTSFKFATPQNYDEFLKELKKALPELGDYDYAAGCVAIPGKIDRENGRVVGYGTLLWGTEAVQADVEAIAHCPIIIENDAKLAGLSEAILIKNEFKNILYITIGTGISCALITDGKINPGMADSEGGQVLIDHGGKLKQWEDISSGKAIVKQFGKRASEINDPETWKLIARSLAQGILDLIAVIQPELIIIGGGVGAHFDKFKEPLAHELKKYETPLVPIPPLRKALRPEEAVIYGCYDLVKERDGSAS